MPSRNDEILDSFIEVTDKLMTNYHEIDISYTELKVELANSIEQVKELTKSLRYSDSKINELDKKIALHEHLIHQLETKYEQLVTSSAKNDQHQQQLEVVDRTGKWSSRAAVIAGVFTVICSIIAVIISLVNHN